MKFLHVVALGAVLCTGPSAALAAAGLFFDDFNYADVTAMQRKGWQVRTSPGHPGVEGARWGQEALSFQTDPQMAGNRLLRLSARTDGTGAGTLQAQICHERKYLEGTYAARIRFTHEPVQGVDGDPVIQTFYAVAPLRHDFDPEFSELDWEYLPNGGWGSDKPRIYGISWQTVRMDPWLAYNKAHEEFGLLVGWHTLMMQVANGQTRWFIDGRQVAQHGGRNYPVVPMAISFNHWFSPTGLLPQSPVARQYEQDIDWVFHARDAVLSPEQVQSEVTRLRQAGVSHQDTVPPAQPALSSRCDF